jgi:hypothetical protein
MLGEVSLYQLRQFRRRFGLLAFCIGTAQECSNRDLRRLLQCVGFGQWHVRFGRTLPEDLFGQIDDFLVEFF